jgi:hypothetical protein
LACLFYSMIRQINEKIKLHLGYKSGVSFSKLAFRIQKLRFVYKYSVVGYKDGFSIYKVASRLSIKRGNCLYIYYTLSNCQIY